METVSLRSKSADGKELLASFAPDCGMNLLSFQKGGVEVIAQSTKGLFEERCAGLGALIGPHFHRREEKTLTKVDKELFPHIKKAEENGCMDPFSHGIARYVPWTYSFDEKAIKASLSGKTEYKGHSLAELEGQDFSMNFEASLSEKGLRIIMTVLSDSDSVLGLHYYYGLSNGSGKVYARVDDQYCEQGKFCPFPKELGLDEDGKLCFDLANEADFGFLPRAKVNPFESEILLETSDYSLRTRQRSDNAENSWQLYHPKGSNFVCIEPLSAANPRKPILTVSKLDVELEII